MIVELCFFLTAFALVAAAAAYNAAALEDGLMARLAS